ncbi:choline transporter [Actinoplanes sp. NBRC 101535]|nr:choline transporter [Actinoplanes sp. NBRC 101535]
MDPVIVSVALAGIVAVVLWGILSPGSLGDAASAGLAWTITDFGWLFVVAADAFLVAALVLAASRYGRIRLGRDDDRPEFSTPAWIAMMFGAGMGIGLIFYAVAEPLQHLGTPPPGADAAPGTTAAASSAMQFTLFHWTLHPWAIYAVVGLAMAYATYRKGRGNSLSAAFHPLLGKHADGAAGRAIDLIAVFATVFGSATSLGLGALQIAAGLGIVTGIPQSEGLDIAIIAVLTVAFVLSAVSGISRGVKWLSSANVVLAAALVLFVFLAGPTGAILNVLPSSIGSYLSNLVEMSALTAAVADPDWLAGWTIFYWAWWISWAPFVGTFIARISRGRTIREFVVGVMLVPSGVSVIWFAVLGGSALDMQLSGTADLTAQLADGAEGALFGLLDALPAANVTSIAAIILIALYFITGADSASLVLGTLSSRGDLDPRRPLVIVWGLTIGAVAAVLLVAGGLEALQQATILVALPFVVVMLALIVALLRELSQDPGGRLEARPPAPASAAEPAEPAEPSVTSRSA